MKTPLSEAELTEGVIPDGHDNVVTTYTAEPKLLGDYTKITDVLDMETLLDIIARQGVELSHNAKRIIDEYIQNKLNSDTNIPEINAGDRADPSALTNADTMSFDLVLNAITYLTSQGVTNERFKVVMHPNNFRDFCKDSSTNTWINRVIYDNFKGIQDGYVTSIENFDIYLSANIKPIVMNEGETNEFNLYPSYALRKGAYGISSLSSLQTYYKPFGSAGIADPLNQIATI
jgi:N4-gp56 family major capsid protein